MLCYSAVNPAKNKDLPMTSANLVADFEAYSAWRTRVTQSISDLQRWLNQQELQDPGIHQRLQHQLDKLKEDRLNIAFVAEFSRGKSELINAIFFADYGTRILPSSAGRTTMCPTELMYDDQQPNSIRLLPIETRSTSLTTSEYKQQPEHWQHIALDVSSAEGMLDAFQHVGQTRKATVEEARQFGLYDDEDRDAQLTIGPDGLVDIPRWRHAVINFPHPLLKQGLVLLDTPGLNAIGTEPELTLNLLPNAHAILFILAADTGVTKSDIDVWRQHISKMQGGQKGRIVVLNKIDGLWDSLKSDTMIDAEIQKQVDTSAQLLGVPARSVYPISAQKGLVAKIQQDPTLLEKSRLAQLERALSEELIPAKQEIVRDNTQSEIEDVVQATRRILNGRIKALDAQIAELGGLKGKNRDVVSNLLDQVDAEKATFEKTLQRFQALRSIFSQQSNVLFGKLGMDALRVQIHTVRNEMDQSWFTTGITNAMSQFFKDISGNLTQAGEQIAEIQAMMAGMYKKIADEHGMATITPPPFSTLRYHKEVARLERIYKEQFTTGRVIPTSKAALVKKFFDSVASRVIYVFEVANRDIETWLKAVMSPMETQVREHHQQLRRRMDSIKRIHQATEPLESRIEDITAQRSGHQQQLQGLEQAMKRVYQALGSTSV
jgi:predicted GTPase